MIITKKFKVPIKAVLLLVLLLSKKGVTLCYTGLQYVSSNGITNNINNNEQTCVCKKENITSILVDCANKDLDSLKVIYKFNLNFHQEKQGLLRRRRHNSTSHNIKHTCGIDTLKLDFQRNNIARITNEFSALDFQTAWKVKELDLSFNRISYIKPDSLRPLKNLIYLSLKYNDLYTMPRIQNMLHLQTLELQYNGNLISVEGSKLPKHLRSLNMAALPIKHISPSLLRNLSELRELDLSQAIGTGLKPRTININSFDDLHNLNTLKLSYTRWSGNILSSSLYKSLKKLKKLEVKSCYLHSMLDLENITTRQAYNPLLVELDLTNNLIQVDPVTTMHLPHLRRLKLSYTRLKNLDENAFKNMPVLESLKMSGLRTKKLNLSCLDNHPSIKALDVSFNNLNYLPTLSPNLKHLDAKGNRIQNISIQVFSNAKSLLVLDLSNQRVHNIESFAFGEGSAIKKLILHNNYIKLMPANAFHGLSNLEELNLHENKLEYLSHPLNLNLLTKLILSNNEIQNISPIIFQGLPKLEFLDLKNNHLINLKINNELTHLTYLNLKQNNLTEVVNLTHLPQLKTCIFSNNKITEILNHHFLKCCTKIEKLLLDRNVIDHIENNAFDSFRNLVVLDLSTNKEINSFQSFPILFTLEKLYLSNSNVSTFPNTFLPKLKVLDLKHNIIVSLGTIPLRVLYPNLQELDLGSNQISHIGDGMLDGLHHLQKIDLKHNQFSCPCAEEESLINEEDPLQTYEYVKLFLTNLTLYLPALYTEIEMGKDKDPSEYYCIKNKSAYGLINLLGESPCNQTESYIISKLFNLTSFDYELYNENGTDYSGLEINYVIENYENYRHQ